MQNSPISFDLTKYLKGLEKRLSVVENRRPGTMYITEKIVTVDPETGVETIIGDLNEYGEDRRGIKQWVGDTEPPPVPSAPIVSSNLGTISVTWDGGNVDNAPQAPDFKHITVYAHAEGSTRDIGTVRSANESVILPDPPYNVVHTFTFKSVDFNGNESASSMMSAEVMATPLVEAPDLSVILEDINTRYDGVITDALQLNDKLSQAELDIDNAQADLIDLETVRLPAVEANIEAAHQEIVATGTELGERLTQAETDINTAEAGLNTLKNTDLPAVKAQIEGVHQELVTTGGQLDSRLDQAETDINTAEAGLNTLKNTDLPALNQRLSDAETEITTTGQQLDERLDDAFIQIGTVDAKAVANATAASNAQTTADNANTAAANAAGIAGSKGKVLVQSTAPGVDDRNAVTLWIDTTGGANTPKRWTSGTTWVAVTDKAATDAAQAAVTAQARADSAHTAAGNAQTTANNALTMAGSKNSVFYSTNAPSGTASLGDTWRRVNATGDVIGEWRWSASNSWVSQQVTTEMISNLDVGKLTAGTANISDLVVEKLWAEVIRAKKITADQLLVGSGSNLIVDPFMEDETTKVARATLSNMSGGYGRNSTTNLNWFGGTQTAGTIQTYYFSTINNRIETDSMIPIVEGSKYRFKFLYNSSGGGARPVAGIVRKDGTNGVTASGFTTNGVATSGFGGAGTGQTMEAVWEPDPSWDYAYFVPGIQWESTVTSAHIYGGASVQNMTDGSLIVNGSIDADSINTNSIVAEVAKFIKLDVSSLIASNATINTAVIEKLWTDVIRSRKITTDQLLVGQGENLIPWDVNSTIPDRTANFTEYGSTGNKIGIQAAVGVADGNHLFLDADWVTPGTGTNTWRIMSDPSASPWGTQGFKVEPEEEFQAQIYVRAGGSYASGMPSVALAGVWYKADGSYIVTNIGTATSLAWTWGTREVSLKAPATAAYLHLYIRQDQPGGIRVDLPSLYRKKGASLIVDGSIAAKQIDSQSVSAEVAKFINLDVSRLVATSATMDTAVINKLWADVVRARKITTDMMVVGSGGNHFPDPLFTDPDGWTYASRITNSVGRNGGKGVVVPASTGQSGMYYGASDRLRQMPVIGGQEYRVGVWVKSSVTIPLNKVTIYVKYTTSSSTTSGSFAPNIQNTGVDGRLGVVPANTWRFLEGITKMPDEAEQALIGLFTESGFNAAVTFSEPSVQTASGTGLIVDGAIEAKHITASESMSAKIGQFLKLDVKDLVSTGTAKMNQAVIDKLWTDVVHSNKITSDMVVIGGTNNVLVDTFFEDEDFKAFRSSRSDIVNGSWGVNPTFNLNWYGASGQPTDRSKSFYFLASSGIADKNAFIPVEPGSKWRLKAKTNSAGSGARFTARYIKLDGSTGYTGISSFASAGIVDHSEVWTIPSDFAYVQLAIQFNTPTTSCYVYGGASMVQMSAGELIVDGAITATKIATNAVESDKIKANAITADKIAVGAIKADHISARGITADKLVVGDGSNVFPDSFMKDLDSWNAANNVTVYTGGYGGGNRARVNGTTGQTGGYYAFGAGLEGRRPDVIPGRTYLVSCYVRPTVAVSSTNAIALFSRVYKKGDPWTGSYSFTSPSVVYNGKALAANVWTEISGQITIPTGDRTSYMPGLYLQSTFPSTGDCDFSMFTLTEMTTGSLIVNGAIDGKTITGNTINGAAIIGGYIRMDGGPEVWQPSIRMSTDALGAYLGFGNVGDGTMGTIRAHNESGTAGPSNVRLELKSPSAADALRRSHVTLYSGWDVGSKHEVAKKPWVDMDSDIEFSSSTTISTYNNGDLKFIARGSDLRLASDTSQGAFVQSSATYDRTYSTSAAMCITGSGVFGRTISALKYKQDVETVNPEDYGDLLLSIDHKSWIDKSEAERYSEYVEWEQEHPNQPIPEEMMEYPTKEPSRHYGAIADDFHDAGLGQYVHYDTNGEVDGLAYERIGVALIPIVRTLKSRVSALEDSYESQKQLIVDLTSRLSVLESESTP